MTLCSVHVVVWNFGNKMPISCQNMKFEEKALDPSFCLDKETLILKKEHPYFYQVQLQMFLTTTNLFCGDKVAFYGNRFSLKKHF